MKPIHLDNARSEVLDIVSDRIKQALITQHDRDRIRAHLARERAKARTIIEGRSK